MRAISKKSRFRSAISMTLSLALLLSLVTIPAFAATPSKYVAGSLSPGATKLTSVVGAEYEDGLEGTVTVEATITAATAAGFPFSNYGNPALQDIPCPTAAARTIKLLINWDGSEITTEVVGAPTDTVDMVLAKINAQLGAASDVEDKHKLIAGRDSLGRPYIRMQKAGSEGYMEIWDEYTATTSSNGIVDFLVYGLPSVSQTKDVSGDPPLSSTGTDNEWFDRKWTFTAINGVTFDTHDFTPGSWDDGMPGEGRFNDWEVDEVSGLFTGIEIDFHGLEVYLATADRFTSVATGKAMLYLANGKRDPRYSCGNSVDNDTFVAGKIETATVNVAVPDDSGSHSKYENAINGVRVLFPADGFKFSANPVTKGGNSARIFGSPWDEDGMTTNDSLVASSTAFGPMLEATGFVRLADNGAAMQLIASLTATTTAGAYDDPGVKIWIRNVGAPLDSWVPLFCPPFCDETEPMYVEPDVLSAVACRAERNRAGGKTLLEVRPTDQYGNLLDPDGVTVTATDASGAANTAIEELTETKYAWTLKGVGINKATVTATKGQVSKTASCTVDTTGIGEPAQVKVVPVDKDGKHWGTPVTEWEAYSKPAFYLQLVDANGNPTSYVYTDPDTPKKDARMFFATMASVEGKADDATTFIHDGWSRSSCLWGSGAPWPFKFSRRPAKGPDTWTIVATAAGGLVEPAPFTVITIGAKEKKYVGVPDHIKVTAIETAPAEYAKWDDLYNNKGDDYDDDAFGYARGDGIDEVVLTAQVVDKYGDPVTDTAVVGNKKIVFQIPIYYGVNGVLPTGSVYVTKTNASGAATTTVKAWRGTCSKTHLPHWLSRKLTDHGKGGRGGKYDNSAENGNHSIDTWFTPIKVKTDVLTTAAQNWANPCTSEVVPKGFGFAYFHSGRMEAELEETQEGCDKDLLLADGVDSTKWEATVLDCAFDIPVAGWPVKFTTNFGSFTGGVKSVETSTGADGKAAVTLTGTEAGKAVLFAIDRQGSVEMDRVEFTDWRTVASVIDATVRAGDRAYAKVRVWWENFRTGQKLMWDPKGGRHQYGHQDIEESGSSHANFEAWDAKVFGWYTDNEGVTKPTRTNWAELESKNATDTNADGKMDAVDIMVPAEDDEHSKIQLESAGKRYALVGGGVFGRVWVGKIFYDQKSITAAFARPEVEFVKEAKLKAEGTQFSDGLSVTGENFTPGQGAPDYVDCVDIFLGDITQMGSGRHYKKAYKWIGKAYVGKDGVVIPVVVGDSRLKQMAPGLYDITVDGLVFKNGLEIKNMFGMASLRIGDAKRSGGIYYLNPYMSIAHPKTHYRLNVNAFGNESMEVWAGHTKLANTGATGLFILPAERLPAGHNLVTAKVSWPQGYTTVVNTKVFRMSKSSFRYPTMSASGRLLTIRSTIKAPAESNGSKAFAVRVGVQRLVGGKWRTYGYKTVRANATTGAFAAQIRVRAAGRYRAFVYHGDMSHVPTTRFGSVRNVR